MSKKKDETTRRSYLKTAGALGVAGLAPTVARAQTKPTDEFERTIEQSLRVKEKTGSVQKWQNFLRNRNFSVDSVSHRYSLPAKSSGSDGISTQHWYRDELDITITITGQYQCPDEYYVDLSWSYINDTSDNHVGGELPTDIAGLYWDPNWWDLTAKDLSQSTATSSYVSYRDGSFDGNGPAFNVDDLSIYADDETALYYCGAYLVPLGDYSKDQRRVYGE